MNPQERSALAGYLDQLVQVRKVDKDPEADDMIWRAVRRQPEAAYLLVRRALLLERALDRSRARIADLERVQTTGDTSFLEPGLSGPSPPLASGPPPRSAASLSTAYAPASGPMPPAAGGAPSFLGQAAATAAGVAGAAFLFEGLQNMFDHHGSFAGEPLAAGMPSPEDVTINNYYGGEDRFEGEEQSAADARIDGSVDPSGEDADVMI